MKSLPLSSCLFFLGIVLTHQAFSQSSSASLIGLYVSRDSLCTSNLRLNEGQQFSFEERSTETFMSSSVEGTWTIEGDTLILNFKTQFFNIENQTMSLLVESVHGNTHLVGPSCTLQTRLLDEEVALDELIGSYFMQTPLYDDGGRLSLSEDRRFEYVSFGGLLRPRTTGSWDLRDGILVLNSDKQQIPEGSPTFRIIKEEERDSENYCIDVFTNAGHNGVIEGRALMYRNDSIIAESGYDLVDTVRFEFPDDLEHDSVVIRAGGFSPIVIEKFESNYLLMEIIELDRLRNVYFKEHVWFIAPQGDAYLLYDHDRFFPYMRDRGNK